MSAAPEEERASGQPRLNTRTGTSRAYLNIRAPRTVT
jgi:hypothetical protein